MFRLCDFVSLKRFGMEVSPMPATGDERVQVNSPGPVRNVVQYGLHLLAVYAIVQFGTMWLAGQMHGTILPLLRQHPPSDSVFQFAFTHLFAFSFFPALIVGLLYSAWFRHRVAIFVWIVPALVLGCKSATLPTSIFQNHFAVAVHEYFGGDFMIPEFHNFHELFQLVAPNPDAMRGVEQFRYTAPAYAAVEYSIGAWLSIRLRIPMLDGMLQKLKPKWRPRKLA
jgi:hypothetical protein